MGIDEARADAAHATIDDAVDPGGAETFGHLGRRTDIGDPVVLDNDARAAQDRVRVVDEERNVEVLDQGTPHLRRLRRPGAVKFSSPRDRYCRHR